LYIKIGELRKLPFHPTFYFPHSAIPHFTHSLQKHPWNWSSYRYNNSFAWSHTRNCTDQNGSFLWRFFSKLLYFLNHCS